MRWPWSSTLEECNEKEPPAWTDALNETHWSHYRDPRNVVPALILTGCALSITALYQKYLKRIPQAINIGPSYWRKRSLFGRVTSVGDADNFRLFHTPGGRLAGWEILPWRKVPQTSKELKEKTVHIRLAGIDAPEMAHFGKPAQPYSQRAFNFLNSYILHRRVRAYVYRRDQYDRAVATVYVRKWLLRRDVGLQMLKAGLATVYGAKTGAEFGNLEEKYRRMEKWAKSKKRGIWSGNKKDYESPRDYKIRTGRAAQST